MPRRAVVFGLEVALGLWTPLLPAQSSQQRVWPAIPQEERDYPSRGYHAVLLYAEVFTDDQKSFETHHRRIKIFTEEGREHADIEIPFVKKRLQVKEIEARTIAPDGTVIPFQGQVFEKVVERRGKTQVLAKTLALPGVQPGSIIEYRYRLEWDGLLDTYWQVDHDLYTRKARFSILPRSSETLKWVSRKLEKQPQKEGNTTVLEVADVPPFQREAFMPPEKEVRRGVEFTYTPSITFLHQVIPELGAFWSMVASFFHEYWDNFIGKRRGIQQALATITSPGDSTETKLGKIYARVQKIRNLSFDRPRTEREIQRADLDDNKNVEDVWKRGYGTAPQINALFVALVRAAGLEAFVALAPDRSEVFFYPKAEQGSHLDSLVAIVRLDNQARFFDPGTPHCPFGLLPWQQTETQALRLKKDGSGWVKTPEPRPEDARILRRATLDCGTDGRLRGLLKVEYAGYKALFRRLLARHEDELGRRKMLEDEIRSWLPERSSVKLKQAGDWEASERSFHAQFEVTIPELVATTARRMILPLSVFYAGRPPLFSHTQRVHPVDWSYPYDDEDEIVLNIPVGYTVEGLPRPRKRETDFGFFETIQEQEGARLVLRRRDLVRRSYFSKEYYPGLRAFFEALKVADEDRTVLHVATPQAP